MEQKGIKTDNGNDKKAIHLLDTFITRFRKYGLKDILADCNEFGNPALNYLYIEIYKCATQGSPMLCLAGAGIFLEELTFQLWASSEIHKSQLKAKFNTWDEVMAFQEALFEQIESQKVDYWKVVRPQLKKLLDSDDILSIELLKDFIRNTYIHSKRIRLMKALSDNDVIAKEAIAKKHTFSQSKKVIGIQDVSMSQTHPMIRALGFQVVAKQLAPAMLIFTYEMFKKCHKHLAPLRDDKIKFPGHECKYD